MSRRALALGITLTLAACGDVDPRGAQGDSRDGEPVVDERRTAAEDTGRTGARGVDSVAVVFTRNEAAVVVRRAAGEGEPLEAALDALLAGPSPQEREAGIGSWFSDATAGMLRSASVDDDGHAIVDFDDLRTVIPNAASSTGSRLLLLELNGTVFGVPEIRTVEYRIDGSCGAFWDWLQYGCQTVAREDA